MERAGASAIAGALALTAAASTPLLAADLAALEAVPQRGQSAEQARRDRYECHNWAVEQTGVTPVRTEPVDERAEARGRRLEKVAAGAAVGALLGGLIRGSRAEPGRRGDGEAADGAIGGAVLGAAVGAAVGRGRQDGDDREPTSEDAYLRALEACLVGRGYVLTATGGAAL